MQLIPVINFETLNNPTFFSRIFELGKLSHAHRLWKWGAFLVAFVCAFNYVINKLKFLIVYYHNKSKTFLANSTQPLLSTFDDDFSSSEDENDVVSVSSDEELDSDIDDENRGLTRLLSYEDFSKFGDDFTVKGQNRKFKVLRRRRSIGDDFSLSNLVDENRIVKLWDGLGVERSFPFLELNKDEWKRFGSFSCSPAVVTTAAESAGVLGLSVWDFRCSKNEPAVQGTWRSDLGGKVVGVDVNRTGRVCVRDDVTSRLTVGDVRMVETPLTEEEEMWWDC